MRPEFDEQWLEFRKTLELKSPPFIEEDWIEAHKIWKILDFFQRKERLDSAIAHAETCERWSDSAFIPKPAKFLKTEWKRPPIVSNGRMTRDEKIAKTLRDA